MVFYLLDSATKSAVGERTGLIIKYFYYAAYSTVNGGTYPQLLFLLFLLSPGPPVGIVDCSIL